MSLLLLSSIIFVLVMASYIRPHVLILLSRMALLRESIGISLNVLLPCYHIPIFLCPTSHMQLPLPLISLIDFPLLYFKTNHLGSFCFSPNQICFTLEHLVVHASLFLNLIINTNFNHTLSLTFSLAILRTQRVIFVQSLIHFGFTYLDMFCSMSLSSSSDIAPSTSIAH